jgi:hypothetical protein
MDDFAIDSIVNATHNEAQPPQTPDFGDNRNGIIAKLTEDNALLKKAMDATQTQTGAGKQPVPEKKPSGVLDNASRAAAVKESKAPLEKSRDCIGNLTIGIFFDGTNNNKKNDWGEDDYHPSVPFMERTHTNVVRLYLAYADEEDKFRKKLKDEGGSDRIYKHYIPGIGTKFPEIDNLGQIDILGGGTGMGGDARILWAMTRVVNSIHQFYTDDKKKPLISDSEAKSAINAIAPVFNVLPMQEISARGLLDASHSLLGAGLGAILGGPVGAAATYTIVKFVKAAPVKHDERRMKFMEWLDRLKSVIYSGITPRLASITIDVFGFSRGAAESRAFVHWMTEVFRLADDAEVPAGTDVIIFAGIPVRFRFVGIFDTVASVGMASMHSLVEGRSAWADNTMQIQSHVKQCVHMVAAHEVRASFPLDSVRIEEHYPPNAVEIVYPGAHSDVGGGYPLGAWGKADYAGLKDLQISRLPGYDMYLRARAAGVPMYPVDQLYKLNPALTESFLPDMETVKQVKNYMDGIEVVGPVEAHLLAHTGVYLGYRWYLGENYYNSMDFVRLGIKAKLMDRDIKKAKEEEFQKNSDDIAHNIEEQKTKKLPTNHPASIKAMEELRELCIKRRKLAAELEPPVDAISKNDEAKKMWDTQVNLVEVVAHYCGAIYNRTKLLTEPRPQTKTDDTYTIALLESLYGPSSDVRGRLDSRAHIFGSDWKAAASKENQALANRIQTKQGKIPEKALVVLESRRDIASREKFMNENNMNLSEDMMMKFALSKKAVEFLDMWRDYLLEYSIMIKHDDSYPEWEPKWLLEALEHFQKNKDRLLVFVPAFFADHVHDSVAGFATKSAEYFINHLGIAKFRRIYFGDRGDAYLRECVVKEEEMHGAIMSINAERQRKQRSLKKINNSTLAKEK